MPGLAPAKPGRFPGLPGAAGQIAALLMDEDRCQGRKDYVR